MDCIKVYGSQLTHRNNSSLLQFLDGKQKSRSADNVSVYTEEIVTEEIITESSQPTRLCPQFSFTFTTYQISDHVQYSVVLNEKYKILGRTVLKKYNFKTRYSMLEALEAKVEEKGLPGKKIFGNKNPYFIQKRKVELENYLNRVARCGSTEFYAFVQQIKDNQFNVSLNERFSIE